MRSFHRTLPVALISAAFLLTACTSGTATSSDPATNSDGGSSAVPSASPTTVVASAKVGECFNMPAISDYLNTEAPVPCDEGTYNEKTIAVLDLPADLPYTYPEMELLRQQINKLPDGAAVPADLQAKETAWYDALEPMYDACRDKVSEAVGTKTVNGAVRSSRFGIDVTGPDQAQWDAGERWVRCNITLKMEPDKNRPKTTLDPLPASLSNAANEYVNQVCFTGEGKTLVVLKCDNKKYKRDGAWLSLTTKISFASLGKFPGSEKAMWNKINSACKSYARGFVQPRANLTNDNYYAVVWNEDIETAEFGKLSPAKMWNTPNSFIKCRIPNWAYMDAPSV